MTEALDIRLSQDEIAVLKRSILAIDPTAHIYLFGSRSDPLAKGGDIDILILSDNFIFNDKRVVRLAFLRYLENKNWI